MFYALLPQKQKKKVEVLDAMEKYNIQNLRSFLESERTTAEICKWFDIMESDYSQQKKEGLITEAVMYDLFKFWKEIQFNYGNIIYEILESHWESQKIEMLHDFKTYTPKYYEIKYNASLNQMDEIERNETEALINELWNKNLRLSLTISYYDFSADQFRNLGMSISRLNRDNAKSEFKSICADLILNRGSLLAMMYAPRGLVEYAAVIVDESGKWISLNETEMAAQYNNEGKPLTMGRNERAVTLNHPPLQENIEYSNYYQNNYLS